MKAIRWTPHALKECLLRDIQVAEVETTISSPDSKKPGRFPREIWMRRYFDEMLQTTMLLRVVVEDLADELVIVTLYKTSKFTKYE